MFHLSDRCRLAAMSLRRRSVAVFILLFALALNVHVIAYAASGFTVDLIDGKGMMPCHVANGETVEEFLTRLEQLPGELDPATPELDPELEQGDVVRIPPP